MKYTQTIGDVKITIEDKRSEKTREERPVVFEVDNVKVTICKRVCRINKIKSNFKTKREDNRSPQPKIVKQIKELEIDKALSTSRDDDFVLVKQIFMEEFKCNFYWKEDDVYEFIGEHCNLYNDKAIRHFDRITKYPVKYIHFWRTFYENKLGN